MPFVTHRYQFPIEWGVCDPAGIVFNSNFFVFFDTGTWRMFEAVLGVNRSELRTVFGIIGFPLVDARGRFLRPAKYGDVVELASTVGEFRRSSFDVQHRITLGGDVVAEGTETRVWAGPDPQNPGKISAKPVPAEVIERFKAD